MSRVLFVCVGNTGRSLMAERLLLRASDGRHEARSAGSNPSREPEPSVVEALTELGIDASDHRPQKLDDELVGWADVVVAACDDACPVVPSKRYENWNLPDPRGRSLAEVKRIRDDIARRVDELLATL